MCRVPVHHAVALDLEHLGSRGNLLCLIALLLGETTEEIEAVPIVRICYARGFRLDKLAETLAVVKGVFRASSNVYDTPKDSVHRIEPLGFRVVCENCFPFRLSSYGLNDPM